MNSDLKDILSNSNKDIDNQQLMDYLSNQLSNIESHAVEENMAEDEFMNDAIEGLQSIENKKDMQAYVDQLNNDLKKQIAKNKSRKEKRRLKDQPYTYFTIVIILILAVLGFIVLKKHLDSRQNKPTVANPTTMVKPKG
jgi:intein/homing endonuclease